MTLGQEEALYNFLDNVTADFNLDETVSFIRKIEPNLDNPIADDAKAIIDNRKLAFSLGPKRWMSRRGFFQPLPFVISPTRLELLNGILIPGHRCLPFANEVLLPNEYNFFWQGSQIPFTTTEGPPEEFYPYYSIYGEEFAPQYITKDNSENEDAYNNDPYADPMEVSIKTLDMRNLYRETSFVPGDRFVVRTLDWKLGSFLLEKVGKDEWNETELQTWLLAAEEGFESSFSKLGTASCTEEQIAYAYWYGPSRMRDIPAYSLEAYLFEKTDRIEITAYGVETRFWYAGREIPDRKGLKELDCYVRPDLTPIEKILYELKIPVSEYLVQAYILDSLFRENGNANLVLERLIPPSVELDNRNRAIITEGIEILIERLREYYSLFTDKKKGPIRNRAGELHTAVIDLAARLSRGDIDPSWLPQHTFIILSQIQNYAAGVMEDLDLELPPETKLDVLDNSLDCMVETYEDLKELIDEALGSYRRNRLAIIRPGAELISERLIQVSIGGTEIWRRLIVPENSTLGDIHKIIQAVFGWLSSQEYKFSYHESSFSNGLELNVCISDLEADNIIELLYEYGKKWNVRIMILSRQETPGPRPVRCVAGAGMAPSELIAGPVRFRRLVSALEGGNEIERLEAKQELGAEFYPDEFDLEICNKLLSSALQLKGWNN